MVLRTQLIIQGYNKNSTVGEGPGPLRACFRQGRRTAPPPPRPAAPTKIVTILFYRTPSEPLFSPLSNDATRGSLRLPRLVHRVIGGRLSYTLYSAWALVAPPSSACGAIEPRAFVIARPLRQQPSQHPQPAWIVAIRAGRIFSIRLRPERQTSKTSLPRDDQRCPDARGTFSCASHVSVRYLPAAPLEGLVLCPLAPIPLRRRACRGQIHRLQLPLRRRWPARQRRCRRRLGLGHAFAPQAADPRRPPAQPAAGLRRPR